MTYVKQTKSEPTISVGIMRDMEEVRFRLRGEFLSHQGRRFPPGSYHAVEAGISMQICDSAGKPLVTAPMIELTPSNFAACGFKLHGVTIGLGFHWQRKQEQTFQGSLRLERRPGQALTLINKIPVEAYLSSVISSEMSPSCPSELLKAHAIISRSWILAEIQRQTSDPKSHTSVSKHQPPLGNREIIRWSGRENHTNFDVCADDHCQRYQGMTNLSPTVIKAVRETYGIVLTTGDEICDARFSKCCGGMTEDYRAAWEQVAVPYLVGIYDGSNFPADFPRPLTQETAAERWIMGSPPAYCNTSDRPFIDRILPDYDQETPDFFRWKVRYRQAELREMLEQRLEIDFGPILALEPLERGVSGRIIRLRISGEKTWAVIGKELEIRRALSRTHLYSSAFVVRPEGEEAVPEQFHLMGAGWGHGVGLCQIGAAAMAEQGKKYQEILAHYYRGSSLHVLYAP